LNQYPSYDLYWAAYCVPKLLVSSFWLLLILNKKAMRQEFVKKARSIIQSMKSGADAINISGLLNPKKLGNFLKSNAIKKILVV